MPHGIDKTPTEETMKKHIYAIWDECASMYYDPFIMLNEATAIRDFDDVVQNAQGKIGSHPEHFTMFKLGEFNDANGEIVACNPKFITTALERVAATRIIKHDLNQEIDSIASPGGTD